MYGIVERTNLFGKTTYEVVKSKSGLGGMGYVTVGTFDDKDVAEQHKKELECLAEQKRLKCERKPKQAKPLTRVSRQDWENHVAECYNDWNREHGYR